MKSFLTVLSLVALAMTPAVSNAQIFKKTPEKLDLKIRKSAAYFQFLQANPSSRIPAHVLQNARGLVILHEFKLGLGIGGEAGSGVAIVRDPVTGQWSPPAFIASADGSYGFQIGGQKSDTVLCLMDEEGMKMLTDAGLKLGVNLRATAGPNSGGGEASIDNIKSPVLVYTNAGGLYAGAAIEGGGVIEAAKANAIYYGLNLEQILFRGKARMTPAGRELINAVNGTLATY